MAGCRFLSSFTLDSTNNGIRVDANENAESLTVTAGTYYWSLDDSVTAGALDFGKALEDALETHTDIAASDVTITIYGVDATDATMADGRVKYVTVGNEITFDFTNDNATLDPRILGFIGTDDKSTSSGTLNSDGVHRYGWYPQIEASDVISDRRSRGSAPYTSGGYVDPLFWGVDRMVIVGVPARPPALIREDAVVGDAATAVLTTTLDPNIAFESWAIDLANDVTMDWRFYEDITDTADPAVEYRFAANSPLWTRPLSGTTTISHEAGEMWTVMVDGQEAR